MTDIIQFENDAIRRIEHNGEWYFSVVDIVNILSGSKAKDKGLYWRVLKNRLKNEGASEVVSKCNELKLISSDGKKYATDCANVETVFRIIQSIPSPKAEPIKQWLAKVGYERIKEVEDPEIAQERMMEIYKDKGYSNEWIAKRVQSIIDRKELTNEWDRRGALKEDYKIFTAIMSKATFGVIPTEHKQIKNLKNQNNLRDHMTRVELALVSLGEATATEIHKSRNSQGKKELEKDITKAGIIAGEARKRIEKETGKPVVSSTKHINIKNDLLN